MMVVISLLRGVNVGGNNMVKMEALRRLYEGLGLRNVQTLLQSGNVLFRTDETDLEALARRIEDGIEGEFGFRCEVLLRTTEELRAVIEGCPFAGRKELNPARLLVTFVNGDPAGRVRYLYVTDGRDWPRGKTTGTGRNWNTVLKLLTMAEQMAS